MVNADLVQVHVFAGVGVRAQALEYLDRNSIRFTTEVLGDLLMKSSTRHQITFHGKRGGRNEAGIT